MPVTSESALNREVKDALREAGWMIRKVWRVLPPMDTDGDAEILFVGKRGGIGHSSRSYGPMTAYLPDEEDAEAYGFQEGW